MKYAWVLEWYPDSSVVGVFSQQKLALRYARKQYAEGNNGQKLMWQRKHAMLIDPTAKNAGYDGICYRVLKYEVVRQVQ